MANETTADSHGPIRILSLDGGGAKGFYTLGVLEQVEAKLGGRPLCEHFNFIYGTSTGAIITGLLALRYKTADIYSLYQEHVPLITGAKTRKGRSEALSQLAANVFENQTFADFKTGVGIVATRWFEEIPLIFKTTADQAYAGKATFLPGFGCTIADAVEASCSAYPFFNRKKVKTTAFGQIELIDGGYCANNPTLFAIADATCALNVSPHDLRVLSIGVGNYPEPKRSPLKLQWWFDRLRSVQLLQKTLEVNTQSMEQLRSFLFNDVPTVRISDTYREPTMATDLFEHDLAKLNRLRGRGAQSYRKAERDLEKLFA